MAKFEVEIPDEWVAAIDPFLKTIRHPPMPQANGDEVARLRFPNGVVDWLPEIVGDNLLSLPPIHQLPSIQAEQSKIAAAEEAKRTAFRPLVKQSKP